MTEQQRNQGSHGLPALYNATRGQVAMTVGAFAVSGLFDVALHNPSGFFLVVIGATGMAGYLSNDVLDMIVPGRSTARVVDATVQAVEALAPVEEDEDPFKDQSARAKILRLLGRKTPPLAYAPDERVVAAAAPAQPKFEPSLPVPARYESPLALPRMQPPALREPEKRDDVYDWYSDNDDEDDEMSLPRETGLFTFSQIMSDGFIPTLRAIYMGSLPDGTPLFVEAKDLCHVALGGNTGGGKSSLLRMLMMQLCKAGAIVLLLNPHYTVYDREHDEDWTPFTPYLKESPMLCSEYANIDYFLERLAGPVLQKRIDRVKSGQLPGKPYFVIIDELPAIVKGCKKNVPGFIEKLLREGRKYGIFLIVGSQDFLVKTIGTDGGAVRQCFRTGYYVGGDPTTAKNLLEAGLVIQETQLGKGTAMLRCAATRKTVMVKVPYVENESLYRMLGPSTFDPTTPRELPDFENPLGLRGSDSIPELPANPHIPTGVVGESLGSRWAGSGGESMRLPEKPANGPIVHVGASSGYSPFTKEDRIMNEEQIAQFMALYPVIGNIQKCLARIEGCSNRYSKHAGMIVREFGLKKEK